MSDHPTADELELADMQRRAYKLAYRDQDVDSALRLISQFLDEARPERIHAEALSLRALGGHPKPANDGHLKTGQT